MQLKKSLVRITTVPISLDKLLEDQLRFMNQYYNVIAVSSNETDLKKVGVKEGVETYCVEMTRKITPFKDVISVLKLVVYFLKHRPEIVHTHTPKAGIVGMLAARITNVPIRLHTVAGLPLLEVNGIKRRILNYVEKLTYRCAHRVYPNSFGLKEIIEEEKFTKPSKLKVIGNGSSNGIDTSYFSRESIKNEIIDKLRQRLNIKEEDFVFVFVGRIVGDKGINELVESFNELKIKYNNMKLLLVGPFEEDLDPIAQSSKAIIKESENIITTGYVNDVRPYYAISDVLVFPSYREGFPNVVMQAGAMGLPSIVSNINGCNEIITHNINGSIIRVKNAPDLFLEMESYVMDREKFTRIKSNARKCIVKNYERSFFHNALLEEYKTLNHV
ncbi:glycosyltransferase family 4 protein [Aestuariivivens marinum]|uniref:glycosyltransferase family 4 protein n=1 Tax=Aestuariivivens marinum TaxID=2913555 RepID=UPI001F5ADEFA|nr:glycosyltransferase family 4 protein [Aestuariivivens marinum]